MESTENVLMGTQNVQSLNELLTFEKKNYRINQIKLICAVACVVICAAIAIALFVNVAKITNRVQEVSAVMTEAGESINEVAKSLNEIDFEALSDSVTTFTSIGTETIDQIKTSTQGLDTMLEEVRASMIKLGSVDINELNNGIKTLNDVLEPLRKFANMFQ